MLKSIATLLVGFFLGAGALAVRAAEPEVTVSRMRDLLAQRKSQELLGEFGAMDFSAWPSSAANQTVDALHLRGRAYLNTKDGARAEADLKQALAIAPKNVALWLTLGENYQRNLNDDAQALAAFDEVHQIMGTAQGWQNLTATLSAVQILTDQVRPDDAIGRLQSLGDPNRLPTIWRIKVLRAYGHAYASQGRDAESLTKFREAWQIESEAQRAASQQATPRP